MKVRYAAFLFCAAMVFSGAGSAFGAEGTWELSEKGNRWMYMYGPDNPAEDEWIEENGKEYYVDSKGYMKTGWVKDDRDGKKYYMGEDGAKCYNTFTNDGHFVGPDGTALESFDAWRKAVKKELESFLKSKEYKKLDVSMKPGFLIMDLNGDGYKDLVVEDSIAAPRNVLYAGVWDPNEDKLLPVAQADGTGTEVSWLSRNYETQTTWLVVDYGNDLDKDYFELDEGKLSFDNRWHFTMELDDWDDPVYYVNGAECELDEWNVSIAEARDEAGAAMELQLSFLTEEDITQAVDQIPDETEMELWES